MKSTSNKLHTSYKEKTSWRSGVNIELETTRPHWGAATHSLDDQEVIHVIDKLETHMP